MKLLWDASTCQTMLSSLTNSQPLLVVFNDEEISTRNLEEVALKELNEITRTLEQETA